MLTTNICGSEQHMVRGRTTAPAGLVLSQEITDEVIEAGKDVETLAVGDTVSVPFNFACGRCRLCKERQTGVCLTVNESRPGGAYGYVDMGGWAGGQGGYVMVPYADFNLLKFPDREQAIEKIRDLTCLSDILPTGYHSAATAGVGAGSTVYVAGSRPVGLAAAASARLLCAAVVIIGDVNPARLEHAKAVGFETVDLAIDTPLGEQIAAILGVPEVDSAVDAVGFEARSHGHEGAQHAASATVLNSLMEVTRAAGKIGIPGLFVTDDPGGVDKAAKTGSLQHPPGAGLGQVPQFHDWAGAGHAIQRALMQAILRNRIDIASVVGVRIISLDEAPAGCAQLMPVRQPSSSLIRTARSRDRPPSTDSHARKCRRAAHSPSRGSYSGGRNSKLSPDASYQDSARAQSRLQGRCGWRDQP